jgi:hypothetical protein
VNASTIKRLTATGDVTTADAYLRAVYLLGGGEESTLTVRAGGSGGTVVLTIVAEAGAVVYLADLHDAACAGGIHATLAGAGAEASIVYA